jgi:glutamate-1-semialdehyde 2,1-aminomutase
MLYTPHDIELAEKIEYYVPCAEKVKFCVTGTEAVQMAIRLARAHTKRRYFIRFEGHYHGWADNVIGGVLDKELIKAIRESGKVVREPFPIESDQDFRGTVGKDAAASRQSLMLPWNDIEVLEKVLERYGGEVAMIHMEPIVCNHFCMYPLPGYLERVREWCVKYGIVLSFDEVITGFRVGLGGAQQELGITPDITTLGKAIAGGMPLSAIVGKNEIMELFTNRTVLGPGTFNGYPFGLAAALATIRILEKDNGAIYKEIDRVQKRLMDGMRKISLSRGIPMLIQGCRGAFYTCFVDKEIAYVEEDVADVDREKSIKFWENMAQEGILFLFGGRWYISAGVTDADVDRTLECADRVLGKL